jgi:hypothetical protein
MAEQAVLLPKPVRQLPEAFKRNIWQKGQTGNPSGKSGEYQRCLKLCRDDSEQNIIELRRLRDHSDDDRVRFMAATWLHERAWGKAKEYDPNEEPQAEVIDPGGFTPKQRSQIMVVLRMLEAAAGKVE